jgi:nitrate reductase alpha subunit
VAGCLAAALGAAKLVVLSPDFSMTSKYADQWIPIHAGQDAAFWLAVDHVILNEFHHEKKTPYFLDYVRRYSDAPFLVELDKHPGGFRPGRMLRASEIARTKDTENGDFKFLSYANAL